MASVSPKGVRKLLIGILGFAIGAGALWLSLRHVSKADVLGIVQDVHVIPLAASIVVYFLATALRGARWYRLLREQTSQAWTTAQTMYVGYAVNNILPARLGEFFRVEYTHRRLRIPRGYCAGALLGERLIDMVCLGLIVVIGIILRQVSEIETLPKELVKVMWAFAILFIVVIALVALVIKFGNPGHDVSPSPSPKTPIWAVWIAGLVRTELQHAQSAIRAHSPSDLAIVFMFSLLIWFLEGLSLYLVGSSLGLSIPITGIAILLFVASLATLVPSAPGYIGTYQLAFVIALSFVGVTPSGAVTAATVQQIMNIGLTTLVGLALFGIATSQKKAHENTILD